MRSKADLLEFVNRDWGLPDRVEREAARKAGPEDHLEEAFRVGDRLREHVFAVRPDAWSTAERLEDFRTHVRVSEAVRSVRRSRR